MKTEELNRYQEVLADLQEEIVRDVKRQQEKYMARELAETKREGEGDVSLKVDVEAEKLMRNFLEEKSKKFGLDFRLVNEEVGQIDYGKDDPDCIMILDLLDGSRPLAYGRDSAYSLGAVAPFRREATLSDVEVAVQTEVPPSKQAKGDQFVLTEDGQTRAKRFEVKDGKLNWIGEFSPTPTRSESIENGYSSWVQFFRGNEVVARIQDEVEKEILGEIEEKNADVWHEQYISSGGQLAMLGTGKYRMVADLRPLVDRYNREERGEGIGLCAHPYDVCTSKIFENLGVKVSSFEYDSEEESYKLRKGINAPFNVSEKVAWVGYGNEEIKEEVEPMLLKSLSSEGLL